MANEAASARLGERRLYQQVADQIRALIAAGRLGPGDRLPAERDLAQQLGVSRPSLREALIALEIEGTIEIRMGSGLYVLTAGEARGIRAGAVGDGPLELMEARAAVEGAVIVLAVARMTRDALDGLRRSVEGMRESIARGSKPLDHDRLFHTTIAAQSGNSVLARIVCDLFDGRHGPIAAGLRDRFETEAAWGLTLSEHEAILAAIEAGDPLLGQAMMHAHLDRSKRRWLGDDPR